MRAMRRVQQAMLAAMDPVAAALAVYDFCLAEREDALLLSSFRRDDFAGGELPDDVRDELAHLNDEIDPFIARLTEMHDGARDLVLLAIRDLPYGAALPHVRNRTTPPPERRLRLERAVRAALDGETG
jgi:hypothetical protein